MLTQITTKRVFDWTREKMIEQHEQEERDAKRHQQEDLRMRLSLIK